MRFKYKVKWMDKRNNIDNKVNLCVMGIFLWVCLNVCFIIYYKEDKFKKNINYIFEKKIVLRFIISSI